MKPLLIFMCSWMISTGWAQTGQQYLFLENTVTNKVKRINLERSSYLYISIDSTDGTFESSKTYTTYSPSESVFGKEEVIFKFSEYNNYTTYYDENESYYFHEDFEDLMVDSTIRLNYLHEDSPIDFYLTYQTKFRHVMYNFGVGLFCASLFNALIVSPAVGLNNGSFNGYNWNRFWRYELYSGLGLAVSIPVSVIFLEKQYYFQTTGSYYDTWRIADGE